MPDIFLSYSRDDQATARRFAEGFEREGFSVWWDQTLRSGENYDQVTEAALREAKAVVVLWSKKSVDSRWVRAEATTADRAGTLVPAMIEPCNRPIMFELKHTAELAHWKGEASDLAWRSFLSDVRVFVQKGVPPVPELLKTNTPKSSQPSSRLPWLVAAVVLLLGGGALWAYFGKDEEKATEAIASTAATLAVLPFVNLSSDPEQEYFSDGLTEEILNQLAQIKALRVTGRTSSFSFKGKKEDLRSIGQKLGVENLLEGSVRRDGDQLRITAQLIDSRDGSHRWSRTYAREMNDMFAVQEEIAREVARVLSVKLDVGELSRAKGGTTDLAAWEKYQQGRQLLLQDQFAKAEPLLREAVAIDPKFALAWTGLWETLRNRTNGPEGERVALRSEMNEAARQTAKLAPESWGAQWISAMQLREQLRWSEAEAAVAQLLKEPLSAENVEKAWGGVFFYSSVGRYEDLIALMKRMQQIEPLSLGIAGDITLGYMSDRRYDELADAEYQRSKSLEGNHATANNIAMLRALGDEQADPEAVRAQLRVTWGDDKSRWAPHLRELYAKVHDRRAAREFWRQEWAKPADPSRGRARFFAQVADALGDRELALDILTSDALKGDTQIAWWLSRSGLRSDSRFKGKLRDLGLGDYFRASGNWGDYCRPVGGDDFECR